MRNDIFNPVVPTCSASLFKAQLPRRQIQIIMNHQQVINPVIVIIQQFHN